jgi:hypothetical protein
MHCRWADNLFQVRQYVESSMNVRPEMFDEVYQSERTPHQAGSVEPRALHRIMLYLLASGDIHNIFDLAAKVKDFAAVDWASFEEGERKREKEEERRKQREKEKELELEMERAEREREKLEMERTRDEKEIEEDRE